MTTVNRNNTRIIAFILAAIIAVAVTLAARGLRENGSKETTPTADSTQPATLPRPDELKPDANTTGALTTRYAAKTPDYIENVFNASKKSLDELKYFRTGETPRKDGVTIYARAHGDIAITITLDKKITTGSDGATMEWVDVSIRYGTWGNVAKSTEIVSQISNHLKKLE